MSKIIVVIDPKTNTQSFEVEGVQGGVCTDITAALTAGKEILQQDLTCEYYEGETRPDYVEGTFDTGTEE